jgi:hypothetical protein
MKQLLCRGGEDSSVTPEQVEQEANDGPLAIEQVARRLAHRDLKVRTRAAILLGEMADPAAIPYLQEALRRSFWQKNLWFHFLVGWLLTTLMVLGCAVLFLLLVIVSQGAPPTSDPGDYAAFGVWLVGLRRRQEPFVCACIEALERIAERDATPASRAIVPFLRGIAVDPLHHSDITRATARQAAHRIEAQTSHLKNVPLPAPPPQPTPAGLPVPSTRAHVL